MLAAYTTYQTTRRHITKKKEMYCSWCYLKSHTITNGYKESLVKPQDFNNANHPHIHTNQL